MLGWRSCGAPGTVGDESVTQGLFTGGATCGWLTAGVGAAEGDVLLCVASVASSEANSRRWNSPSICASTLSKADMMQAKSGYRLLVRIRQAVYASNHRKVIRGSEAD